MDRLLHFSTRVLKKSSIIKEGDSVLLVDDLVATGGTLVACRDLVRNLGADIVGISVLIELIDLDGAALVAPDTLDAVLRY